MVHGSFSESGGNFHESYFEHPCLVATEKDVLDTDIRGNGWCASLSRWWHGCFLLSYSDLRCPAYYSSSHKLRLERARHFRRFRGRIHPLSKFSNSWDLFILVLSVTNRVVIHQNTSITFGRLRPATLIAGIVLELLLMFDVFIRLKTGYIDNENRKIILNSKRCKMHYASTQMFFHVSSVLPLQAIMMLRYGLKNCSLCRGNRFVCCLQFLSLFGIWRVHDASKYFSKQRRTFRTTHWFKLFRILVLAIVTMLQFLNFLDSVNLWLAIDSQFIDNTSRFYTFLRLSTISDLSPALCVSLQFSMIVKYLFSYGYEIEENAYYFDTLTGLTGFIIANLFKMWAFVVWFTVVHRKKSKVDHMHTHLEMTMNVMKARQVSDEVTCRIKEYYNFVVSRSRIVTKQNQLYKLLPTSILREIKLANYYHLIRKVKYFQDWPHEMLKNITYMLKEDVYLERDIVAPRWSQGEGLMILAKGVLAVYSGSANNEEVGHLIDGDYFGELSLVTDREIRTSSVVAVTPCEMLILYKKTFRSYMRRYSDLFFDLREEMRVQFSENPSHFHHLSADDSSSLKKSDKRHTSWDSSSDQVEKASDTRDGHPNRRQRSSLKVQKLKGPERIIEADDLDELSLSTSSRRSRIRWRESEDLPERINQTEKDDK